jgi:2'-5' RNA ligase
MSDGIISKTGQTALVINFPQVDTVVHSFRELNDPYHCLMDAHITIAIPFFHITKITRQGFEELETIAKSIDRFTIKFNKFGQFPHVLFLKPDKDEIIKEIHQKINLAFPRLKLYGGSKFEYTPHLTIAQNSNNQTLDKLQQENTHLLTLSEPVEKIDLFVMKNNNWESHTSFYLR